MNKFKRHCSHWTPFLLLFLFSGASSFAASTLSITSPSAGSTLSGPVPFSVTASSDIKTVEYLLNERVVAGPIPAPFQMSWDTRNVWNGPGTIKAVGRDGQGKIVATSALVPLSILNSDISVRILSPQAYSTLSGQVTFTVEVYRTNNSAVPVDGIMFFVDGHKQTIVYAAGPAPNYRASINVNTAQFANGPHTLFAGIHATGTGNPPVAMAQVPVQFANGRTASRLLSGWRDVFLTPGETATLRPSMLWTNLEKTAVSGASFSSQDSSIASVSPGGVISAQKPGVTEVQISAQGMTASARVVVNSKKGFPHFSRDGQMLQTYDPARSFFPRSLFYLEAKMLDQNPALAAQVKAASINAMESGFYLAKQDLNNPQSLADFRKSWDPFWGNIIASANRHNMRLVLNGDNLARFPSTLNDNLTWPWAPDAIKHVFTTMRDSKMAVSLEMVDESSGMWGDTPFPTDGRWMKYNPPIPDTAFQTLMGWINVVPNRPPLSWPILWLSGEKAAGNWMGDPRISDYASNYWDTNDWRIGYPWGLTLPQSREGMDNVVRKRLPLMQRERPATQLISIAGPYYTKLGPGTEYTVGQDRLQSPAIRPEAIPAQIFYGVALGQAGIRAYAYDAHWKDDRSKGAIGAGDRQTGAEPFQVGTDRWLAMSAAFHLADLLNPYLFQQQSHAPDLGPGVVTGVRTASFGALLLAVNFSDQTTVAQPDLTPYLSPAARITRYRLHGHNILSNTVATTGTDSVTMQPGEVVAWVMDNGSGERTATLRIDSAAVSGGGVDLNVVSDTAAQIVQTKLYIDGVLVDTRSGVQAMRGTIPNNDPNVWRGVAVIGTTASGQTVEARASIRLNASSVVAQIDETNPAPPPPPPANRPPQVAISSPANQQRFTAPANVDVVVSASDADGNLSKVELFNGSTLAGTLAAPGYTLRLSNLQTGSYTLTARASDTAGAVTNSDPVVIVVEAGGPVNQPPTVSISTPANQQRFTAPADVPVKVTAGDPDNNLTKVELLRNGAVIQVLTAPAYSTTMAGMAQGSYTLTARATDAAGATTTSAAVSIVVDAAAPPPPPPGEAGAFVTGINLAGAATTVEGNAWQGLNEAMSNGTLRLSNAQSWSTGSYQFPFNPAADAGVSAVLRSAVFRGNTSTGQGVTATVRAANGDYQVYVWFLENYRSDFRSMNVAVQGTTVANGIGQLPLGAWEKAGPFAAKVTNGELVVDVVNGGKGDPALFGLALFRAGTPGGEPAPPQVAIASPSNGAKFGFAAGVPVTVDASSSAGLARVELFDGAALLKTWTAAPYTHTATGLTTGVHTLTAKAYDAQGRTATSAAVSIEVSPNQAPQVALTSPANNTSVNAPGSFTLAASASDADGTIQSVQFFQNQTLLATVTNAPYQYTWQNVAAGSYTLTARATDSAGASATSAAVTVLVNAPPPPVTPPSVTFVTPAANATFASGKTVNILAEASANGGRSITAVEFREGSQLIARVTTAPYSWAWNNVSEGVHTITATAVDSAGVSTTSAPRSFTMQAPAPPPPTPGTGGTFVLGVNLGGGAIQVDGNSWKSHSQAQSSGLTTGSASGWTAPTGNLNPSADTGTAAMLGSGLWRSSTWSGVGFSVNQTIPNGTYLVYFYAIENYRNNYRRMEFKAEGKSFTDTAGDLPLGGWAKYGPYEVTVTDGTLHLEVLNSGKGDPSLSGFSVFQ